MRKPRRQLTRAERKRRYRKLFIVATEGTTTEKEYLELLDQIHSNIRVAWVKGNDETSPGSVLKRMNEYLKQEEFENEDEAWLVIDKDSWSETEIAELFEWSNGRGNRGFALSNPKFEYWLLLHFEAGKNVKNPADCTRRLRTYLPSYDKKIERSKFPAESIVAAMNRARKRDQPPCVDWPRQHGRTTMYRLIEKIKAANDETLNNV